MKNTLFALLFVVNVTVAQETGLFKDKDIPQPLTFRSEEVDYWNVADSVHIFGTLTMPEHGSKFPAVLLITGSGTQDRDETLLGHKLFKVIAEYLTGRGFAVLRVDDRGAGKTTLGRNPRAATSENFAGDVLIGVNYLKTRSEINRKKIGLIGHSEGGMIAPMVASRSKDVAFIVSLAGTGVPGRLVTRNQLKIIYQKAGIDSITTQKFIAFNDKILDITLQAPDAKTMEEEVRQEINNLSEEDKNKFGIKGHEEVAVRQIKAQSNAWGKFFANYDPAVAWEQTKCPVLLLNGTKDTQVDPTLHLPAIENSLKKAGNKHYKIVKLEGLNHLFQHANTGLMDEYAKIQEDFAPEALDIMGDWLVETVK